MKHFKSLLLLLIAILASVYLFEFFTNAKHDIAAKHAKNYAPGEVLVKFKPGTPKRVILAFKIKLNVKAETFTQSIQVYHWKGDFDTDKAIQRLKRSSHIQYAEPNYSVGIEGK